MKKPTVILVGPLPPPVHGVTISTQRLLNSSLRQAFELHHLDTSDHRPITTVGLFDIRNVALGLLSYWHLLRLCIRHRPDVVYVPISQTAIGFLRDSVYLVLPFLFFRAAVVIHLRGGHFGRFYEATNLLMRRYVDLVMRCVARVIVLGKVFRPIFTIWFDEGAIDVVPNGTDIEIGGVEAKLRAPNTGTLTVTFMSTLVPEKGFVEFFEAARRLVTDNDDVTFLLAGDWQFADSAEERDIKSVIAREGLEARVRFLGEVHGEEKVRLLADTDIFVLPTYYPFEGHPNAIIEAMAAGCAVVSTDHAAIPETVLDGETGIIVPTRDAEALAAALRRLIRDRTLLLAMARASYARYRSHYSGEQSSAGVGASIARAAERAGHRQKNYVS